MFNFFKKKPKAKVKSEPVLSDDEKKSIEKKLLELMSDLKKIPEEEKKEKAIFYEQVGLLQGKLNQVDEAINSLEKSLAYQLSIGDGYKKLMSLYNKKRAESARNGDDAGINYYMDKMDEMRQIAKKVTLSR